ncbi:PEP-CTERM-box response regulator transcription factor [Oceanidesulfovibrio marinus]|uniref:PEP-CTERM-box response regulator transcription factor n=1 Tax=Oceanidesulfovibrio marinus TaxID=370038 RepID=A0A6P1ZAB5_9BACT|nr:PEP-CTERM-box response regulator transcription factor [Oceanidesulfovibrio marinus]QJT07974.1 PEP-CTERM-box response regulator transcription factor [Oceanidesulfovibrio marinus]TVM30586.1 PEP-CTERM-box response regulator transcription factor [Oceanidesulfovibrio marinus]
MQNSEHTVLLVDDDDAIRTQLRWGLSKESFTLKLANDRPSALEAQRKLHPKVVALDLGLPPDAGGVSEGLKCLEEMLRVDPFCKVVVITGNDTRDHALAAIASGAYDFYRKPVDLEELRVIIERALHVSGLEEENRQLREQVDAGDSYDIVGDCPAMQDVLETVRKVAGSDIPVLVLGESGTGKELVARALHKASPRGEGPLMVMNCGAIPENLLESEFFGHEKGAFTGAHARVKGKAEYAHQGTLFLDEIGDLPLHMQVKLLRFIEEKRFQRVGGREDIDVDIRLVAATNANIAEVIERGDFREDLYYRLGVVVIHLPPLRERGRDVETLARYFVSRIARETPRRPLDLSPAALEAIRAHSWPGNVRELENKIRRAAILCNGPRIEPGDLDLNGTASHSGSIPGDATLKDARNWLEREMVARSLDQNEGNISLAAKALGISRPTFYDLMKKHALKNA